MLTATDIRVMIGAREVLHGISFTAQPGSVTAIVGPNGSGKSTLLKAMTGDIPFDGTVTLNGENTATMKPWELAAIRAVLPQASRLAFPFSVGEVVGMGLRQGLSGGQTDLVETALARVGLGGFAPRFYQELSGGEQQRAQLARVLVQVWTPCVDGTPRWLFLDEPVASLDIAHQLTVMDIARSYARQGGGVIAVMHDLNLTALYADSVAVIESGHLLAQGAPDAVLTNAVLSRAYGCQLQVNHAPPPHQIFVLPHGARA
ncbi:MAG: heme ABC transporter ATP-binding protein [Silicimonas sp.]|nr:heme ABC transporter ATP-binding protein [Silicimonas sp.]